MPSKGRIIVFGIAFWYPLAGVTYQFLHFLLGLRRLGYDVYYVEDSGRYTYNIAIEHTSPDPSQNLAAVAPILEAHGFAGRWCYRGAHAGGSIYGLSLVQLRELYKSADAFLNVTGAQEMRAEHLAIPRRIYVETDPVVSQIKAAYESQETLCELAYHDTHFTYGENIGRPDCLLPVRRFNWLPTRQPVALDLWEHNRPAGPNYTTITTWRNTGRDIVFNGKTYLWSKHHEFLKLIDLPSRLEGKARFELAIQAAPPVWELLRRYQWQLCDARAVSRDCDGYRRYIQDSRGEFTVAKDQNIRLRSGWFSDRDACYLAAGRPVITQETGFSNILPTGRGLFGFENFDDIRNAVTTIESDHAAASRAAREIAQEYFRAETVLASLMKRAGLG